MKVKMPLIHRGNGTLKIEFDLQDAVFLCQNTLKNGIERECVRCRERSDCLYFYSR